MTDEVKPEVIKRTQDLLGKYFRKPPLTEKLLRKPPFRFLHDIVSAIMRETGFLQGLFAEEELNSENVKEKEAKLAYLTKLVEVVKLITGANLTVRPSKIIAGQEATKTNELLQAIGRALDKNLSSAEAIEQYKKSLEQKSKSVGGKDATKKRSSSQSKKVSEKDAEQKKRSSSSGKTVAAEPKVTEKDNKNSHGDGQEKVEEVKQRNEVAEAPAAEPVKEKVPASAQRKKPTSSARLPDKPKVMESPKERKSEDAGRRRESASKRKQSALNTHSDVREEKTSEVTNDGPSKIVSNILESEKAENERDVKVESEKKENKEIHHVEIEKSEPVTADVTKGQSQPVEANNDQETIPRPRTSLRPPSARPISARPAAPRMRAKPELIVNEEIATPLGNISVIVENADARDDDDDAEDMVVMESRAGDSLENTGSLKIDSQLTQEHGHLVAQILETQRELVNTDNVEVLPKKVEIAWEPGSKRDREAMVKEVEKLRNTIQTLTRATNPLGKLLDYVQEDVEIMQRELLDWQSQYLQLSEELEREKMQTRELIEPMKEALREIDYNTKDQLDKICQVKARIMKNDQKIQRLLNGNT